jgi:pimeloyl-ACP methyl ester carboxylesterase
MNNAAVINPAKKPEILAKHLAHFSDFQSVDAMMETYFSASHDDILSFANEISVPTLVISGNRDNIAPEKETIELSQQIPNGKFVVIANVGHILHHETPSEVSKAIVEFLK